MSTEFNKELEKIFVRFQSRNAKQEIMQLTDDGVNVDWDGHWKQLEEELKQAVTKYVIGETLSDTEMPNFDRRQGHNRLVSKQRKLLWANK